MIAEMKIKMGDRQVVEGKETSGERGEEKENESRRPGGVGRIASLRSQRRKSFVTEEHEEI